MSTATADGETGLPSLQCLQLQGYHADNDVQLRDWLRVVAADSLAKRLRGKLLKLTKEQVSRVSQDSRFPGSSEVLESIIGKYKTMRGGWGQFGVTGMLLSAGAFVGHLTVDSIGTALATINAAALKEWEKRTLARRSSPSENSPSRLPTPEQKRDHWN